MSKVVKTALLVGVIVTVGLLTGQIQVGTLLGEAIFGTSALLGTGLVASAAIVGAVIGAGFSVLSSLASPSLAAMDAQAGAKFPVTNRIDTAKYIYGTMQVGGTEIFIEEYDSIGGNDVPNDTLVFARVVADHIVDGFGDFYMGDELVSFDGSGNAVGDLAGNLFLKTYDGSQTAADPWLMASSPGWSAAHTGRGVAYYVVKAIFDPEKFPYGAGGVRNCNISVRGKRVYDPRLDDTQAGGSGPQRLSDPASWAYSDNAALCLYDYMRDDWLGPPVPDVEINRAALIAAANACDEPVALKGGGTQPRYVLNGIADSARLKSTVINEMLTAMAGRRVSQSGQYFFYAGVGAAPAFNFDESNATAINYETLPADGSIFNEVRGTFINPAEKFETVDFPAYSDSAAQASEGRRVMQLNLPFTHDHRMAQRIARIELMRSRQAVVALDTTPAALALAPWSVATVGWDNLGLAGEQFRLKKHTATMPNGGAMTVSVSGIGETPAIYAWDPAIDEQDRVASPGLSQPTGRESYTPAGVSVTAATDTAADGGSVSVIVVVWDAPGAAASGTLVDYRKQGEAAWRPGVQALRGDTEARLPVTVADTYEVRTRHMLVNGSIGPAVINTGIAVNASAGAGSVGGFTGENISDIQLSSSVNLLGTRANDEQSSALTTGWRWLLSLDELGLEEADTVSFALGVKSDAGLKVRATLEWMVDAATFHSQEGATPWVDTQTWTRQQIDGAVVPAGVTYIRIGTDNFDDDVDGVKRGYLRRGQLNFGSIARRWAPVRLDVEEGATLGADETNAAPGLLNENIVIGGTNLVAKSNWDNLSGGATVENDITGSAGWTLQLAHVTGTAAVAATGTAQQPWDRDIYSVSFTAWAGTAGTILNIDFYPDTLPGTVFTLGSTPTRYKFEGIDGDHPDIVNAFLRFFIEAAEPDGTAYVTDIMVEKGNKASDWQPAPRDEETLRLTGFTGDLDADLTSQNTSADTAAVNGTAAVVVDDGAGRALAGLTSSGDVTRNLPSGIGIVQTPAVTRQLASGIIAGLALDGDVISFSPSYNSPPRIIFGPGGILESSALTGGAANQVSHFVASGLDSGGFTADLKLKELAGSGGATTDTGAVATGTQDWEIAKSVALEAFDDVYTFQFDVNIVNVEEPEGQIYFPGWIDVGLYTKASSEPWTQRKLVRIYGGSSATTQKNNLIIAVTVDGLASTADRFGVSLITEGVEGGSVTAFDSVSYTAASDPASASATPSGAAPIFWMAIAGEGV